MYKLCQFIRTVTVPPVSAAIAMTLFFLFGNGIFTNSAHYAMALFTLTVLPLLPYPISLVKPAKERRGFQRRLAIIFSVIGYIIGLVFALCTKAPSAERVIYSTYLLSGLLIALCSFVFKHKSSGHACGIAGPAALLCYYISPFYAFCFLLLLPVSAASVQMKRHTLPQLITGSIIPILCMLISVLIF